MPTEDQKQNLDDAIERIKKAETALLSSSGDKVQAKYDSLDELLTKIIEAKEKEDDEAFNAATGELKQLSSVLQTDQDELKAIVGDAKLAAEIAGYLTEAAEFLAKI